MKTGVVLIAVNGLLTFIIIKNKYRTYQEQVLNYLFFFYVQMEVKNENK